MKSIHGLYKAAGGFAKRERECLDGTLTCKLARCDQPSAGYVSAWNGAQPVCAKHIPGAEQAGYTVVRAATTDEGHPSGVSPRGADGMNVWHPLRKPSAT